MDVENYKGVEYFKIGESDDGKKTLMNNNEMIFIDENENKIDLNIVNLEKEHEIFLEMKMSYPNLLKDATFEDELKDAIKYIGGQLEDYYIDMRDGSCNELAFGILRIAFQQYKESHHLT